MHTLKLTVAALAALFIGIGSASAVEAKKKIGAPAPLQTVWATIGEFCSIKDWHPAVADCQETKEGDVTFRTITLKDNGGTIKEKLTGSDDTSYSYEIVESPLPVENYQAKFWIEEDERQPERSVIHWEATFDPKGATEEEAEKKIEDIFYAGLKNIKQMVMPAEGTVGGD
jgi:hypothetical protein